MKSNAATAVHELCHEYGHKRAGREPGRPTTEALPDDKQGLEEINGEYQDLMDGKNICGVIVRPHRRPDEQTGKERSEQ